MKSLQYTLLTDSEKDLVLAARPKQLRKLDEDELLDLHKRARRARNKYVELHRRRAGAQVRKDGTRAKAKKRHRRIEEKAEIFEEVLARVSRHLSVAARRSSEALRAERLGAARGGKGGTSGKGTAKGGQGSGGSKGGRRAGRSGGSGSKHRSRDRRSIERRRAASQRAAKRRHEARRR